MCMCIKQTLNTQEHFLLTRIIKPKESFNNVWDLFNPFNYNKHLAFKEKRFFKFPKKKIESYGST